MKIHNDPQRSDAWYARRLGIPTASKFDKIITPQGKRSTSAKPLMYQLAYETISGKLIDRDLSGVARVQHGIISEPIAVEAFENHTGMQTAPVGFITDDSETIGCSPDRIITGRPFEALEIKCPEGYTHCGYLIDGLRDAYKAQIQGQILIGGFKIVHFFSWRPDLPPYYVPVKPDPEFLDNLIKYLAEFTSELAAGIAYIRTLGNWPSNVPSAFPDEETM